MMDYSKPQDGDWWYLNSDMMQVFDYHRDQIPEGILSSDWYEQVLGLQIVYLARESMWKLRFVDDLSKTMFLMRFSEIPKIIHMYKA